jgi:hypothetical protein
MTNREHALNLFKDEFEKHKFLLKSEKEFLEKGHRFFDSKNRAYLRWEYAQDEFDIFITYLRTHKIGLDDEVII